MNEHLGDLQQLIMAALLRLGPEAYGARIRRELMDVAGRNVSVSAIYVTLVRLEEEGLVESADGTRPSRGGRKRRFFTLTREGQDRLLAAREATNRMWDGIDVRSSKTT